MIRQIVAIRDRAVDAFGVPFFVAAIGEATRSFSDEVNRKESPMNPHPEDYDLYHVGVYDDSVGAIRAVEPPRMLSRAQDVIRS